MGWWLSRGTAENKKTGVVQHLSVPNHAGLLCNGPPKGGLPFIKSSGFAPRLALLWGLEASVWYTGCAQWQAQSSSEPNPLKTIGEIEAAVSDGITRIQQEYLGRGPKDIRTHLFGDLIVVRLQGVLTAAEQQLVKSLPMDKGRDLLKQVRTQLIETARPLLETMIEEATGQPVVSLHHDISTRTGEEVMLFTLVAAPKVRELKRK